MRKRSCVLVILLAAALALPVNLAAQSSAPLPPLPPNPVYPSDGLVSVPSNFTLRWNSGLDAARTSPSWPVTYAIYYKYWAYGGAEPASYSPMGNSIPCNPDSTGTCTMPVSGLAGGNYRFYIVANMNVSATTGVSNSILSTPSSAVHFAEGYQPISTIPSPLLPNILYPSNGLLNAPASFNLRWNSGLDASRTNPSWLITYAIYYKFWASGGTEPASYSSMGNAVQCNADSLGLCMMHVSGIGSGNYRFYIVANMDVSASTGVPNSILSTQSSATFFADSGQNTIQPGQGVSSSSAEGREDPANPPQYMTEAPIRATLDIPPPPPPPAWVTYHLFFVHLANLDQLADQQDAAGLPAVATKWRTYEQRAIGLSDTEAAAMKQVAHDCNDAVNSQDATIQTRIQSLRGQYPAAQLALPSPSDLTQLGNDRISIINSYISELQAALSTTTFQKLDSYIQQNFLPPVEDVPAGTPTGPPMPPTLGASPTASSGGVQ